MCFKNVIFFSILSFSYGSIVKFLPSTSFNLPINFKDGRIPCSKETVIFPETVLRSIKLESKATVKGLILPKDGEIILNEATIEFGTDEAEVNCTHAGNVYYLEKAVASWGTPDIWSSPKFNDATPDAERVPCFDDIVVFDANAQFTLTLPNEDQVVAGIKVGDKSYDYFTFVSRVMKQTDELQQFLFNSYSLTGLRVSQEVCTSRAGCPCQRHPPKIDCEAKYCTVPTCSDPIKPIGNCCKICGGVISFDVDEGFDIITFKELVEKTVESYGIDDLVYHISKLPWDKIQLVVVDKREYSGTSAEVVNDIDNQIQRNWVQSVKYVDFSGSPLYKSGLSWKIFVSVFFMVVLVMGGIYLYYYKLPAVYEGRFPILHRNTPGVFSTFQRRTDSVVCLTRKDSVAPMGVSEATSFRNPLYDSTRHRPQVEKSVEDE